MAFDQSTRNRLQRFVNDARRVLEEEFTRQFQNDYGMDPNAGSVVELASLRHINDAQRETARILRDTLAHYSGQWSGVSGQLPTTDHRLLTTELQRIVREQAFTVLNRLAALRMAEARGLLVESVGNGFQAKGFQLYARLAGAGLGETGDAYRTYLFSVFDELAQDLPGLFDRYSPQGRLFPREAALLQVLNLINAADIAPLWSEDETIGWIYQYFNSKEERRAMRDASQAPRNSRELAVRNQFFTPRYVVEFLVDNTLGRLWFNATGGETHLRDRCQYLLVDSGQWSVASEKQLVRNPIITDHRPPTTKLRDPRTLKLLDPACGSMHFGLYAFDLLAEIYRESWAMQWKVVGGRCSVDSVQWQGLSESEHERLIPGIRRALLDAGWEKGAGFPSADHRPLITDYCSEAAYLRDIPRLIIEHNIYGVDIDPRAAQIASLALWLRAQRTWHDAGVKAKDRPLLGHGHVVAATAPPAERELRQQFAAGLDHLDAELFEKTLQLLNGLPELGVLLPAEKALPALIRQVFGEHGPMFRETDMEQWHKAEARLREALTDFARAAQATYQGRLFAQDALQGLRLIDLCREVFDVVVMNPPFGALAASTKDQLAKAYPRSKNDLLAIFVERGLELLRPGGRIGAITSRTCFFLSSFQKWREAVVLGIAEPEVMADLGHGVMDDAMVEAAAYCLVKH
ncbi:MAG: SAM-dependent methyltransferase [Candidatus Competibacteraceae bacterium]|nr:MAG: SAM-dependent methyltransferase [Candidatus Competibacteraceae bacterium]